MKGIYIVRVVSSKPLFLLTYHAQAYPKIPSWTPLLYINAILEWDFLGQYHR